MENTYSIRVENRYQLFLDSDEDPSEELKIQQEIKKKDKLTEKVIEDTREDATPRVVRKMVNDIRNSKLLESKISSTKSNKEATNKSQMTKNYIRREETNKRENRRQVKPFDEKKTLDNRHDRKKNGGENFKRESRSNNEIQTEGISKIKSANQEDLGGNTNIRGKRQFDRLSRSNKTGIKPIDKREGGGAHNWGSYQDDMNEVSKSGEGNFNDFEDYSMKETNKINTKLNELEASNKSAFNESDKPDLQEESKEMTLDEYKAIRGNREKPMYNLRKPNEGEDQTQWQNMYALSKRDNIQDEEEEAEYDRAEYPQRVGRQKLLLGIKYLFKDRFGRIGRGRRGGSREESSRRSPPASDSSTKVNEDIGDCKESLISTQNSPKLDYEKDFPSLG